MTSTNCDYLSWRDDMTKLPDLDYLFFNCIIQKFINLLSGFYFISAADLPEGIATCKRAQQPA